MTSNPSETSNVSDTSDPSETSNAGDTRNVSDSNEIRQSVAELKSLVAELAERLQTLEEQAAQWHPEVSEDVLLAISAACAAYLGERATIKQVHLRRGGAWASQGRAAAQQSHADLHGYGDRQAAPTTQGRRGMR
jgi:methylmalonyl-CoA carboxyltransferase large subunit